MSHCSTFDICFKDKRILYKALRNLKMEPENQIWSEYSSQFSKMLLGKTLGMGGRIIGRLLTAKYGKINVFFMEEEKGLVPYFESHQLSEEELNNKSASISLMIQKQYLKCAVEKMAEEIVSLGGSARVTEASDKDVYSVTLSMDEGSKKLIMNLDRYGIIKENVIGVAGKSCLDLTEKIESSLGINLKREWTYEYDTLVEDRVVQVLKLNGL